MPDIAADKVAIRELVENWAVARPPLVGSLPTCGHAEAASMATWFQGGFEEFIKVNDDGAGKARDQ